MEKLGKNKTIMGTKTKHIDCQKISESIDKLKVNSRGSIRGKNKVIDEINRAHLKEIDSRLMDVRVFVAQVSTGHDTKAALKLIDEFIYKLMH